MKTQLQDRLRNFISLDDKVAAVLYATEMKKITTNQRIIHPAFFKISREYGDFFRELRFKLGGRFPYSEDLDHVFPGLTVSGLVACENPEYQFYLLDEERRKKIEKSVLPLFSKSDRTLIDRIGKELATELQKKLSPP